MSENNPLQILVSKNRQILGPYNLEEVEKMLRSGIILQTDMASIDTGLNWQPLLAILPPSSAGLLQSLPLPPPPPQTNQTALIVGGYVCALGSLFFCPPVFGVAGAVIGIVLLAKGVVGHGIAIIVLSLLLLMAGLIIGALVGFQMSLSQ